MADLQLSKPAAEVLGELRLHEGTLCLAEEALGRWRGNLDGLPDALKKRVGLELLAAAVRLQRSGDARLKVAMRQLVELGLRASRRAVPKLERVPDRGARLLGRTEAKRAPEATRPGPSSLLHLRAKR